MLSQIGKYDKVVDYSSLNSLLNIITIDSEHEIDWMDTSLAIILNSLNRVTRSTYMHMVKCRYGLPCMVYTRHQPGGSTFQRVDIHIDLFAVNTCAVTRIGN